MAKYGSSLSNQQWYYGHKQCEWPIGVVEAAYVCCSCQSSSVQWKKNFMRHKTWRRDPYHIQSKITIAEYIVPNEKLPKQVTTCVERVNEWRQWYKESYATSTIQASEYEYICWRFYTCSYCIHSLQNRVISCTLDNFLLGQVDRYGCALSLFNIHAILGWWRVARDGMETRRTWRLCCFPHVGIQSCRHLRLSLPPWPRLEIKEQRYRKFGEMTLSIETDKVVLVVK
jgi:hypothetical protein